MQKIISKSVSETIELGKKIGNQLKGGEVFAITGNLGAGKTHLIKGIAAGICGQSITEQVCSPTFVLVREYLDGRLDIYHIDAYRIESTREFDNLGFDDMCTPGSVVLVEWANKVENSLQGINTISINLSHIGKNIREITITGLDTQTGS